MPRQPLIIYAETSVFGGIADREFTDASRAFFQQVRQGVFKLVLSPLLEDELQPAPDEVRVLLHEISSNAEVAEVSVEAQSLQAAFLDAGILTEKSANDALHVAIATVEGCFAIISWNFRHIVHYDKIAMYNAVSAGSGYLPIAIYSPSEIIRYEDQDV